MAAMSSGTFLNAPRRNCRSVMSRKQRSTIFSHEAEVDVKCRLKRGCLASHASTTGCLCVPSYGLSHRHTAIQARRDALNVLHSSRIGQRASTGSAGFHSARSGALISCSVSNDCRQPFDTDRNNKLYLRRNTTLDTSCLMA